MHLEQHNDRIWSIHHFLSPEKCAALLASSEQIGYQEAEVSLPGGARMMKGLRNNYRLLHQNSQLAEQLWKKLQAFCPTQLEGSQAIGLNDQFRFYKYESDQRFKRHIDGRFKRNDQEESRITFMIYLNNDFEGGETAFDEVVIRPKVGSALCFIHELKHEGRPVTAGIKYVLRSDVMYRNG